MQKISPKNGEPQKYSWGNTKNKKKIKKKKKKNCEAQRYGWGMQKKKKKNGEPQRYFWGMQKRRMVNPRDISGERRRRRMVNPRDISGERRRRRRMVNPRDISGERRRRRRMVNPRDISGERRKRRRSPGYVSDSSVESMSCRGANPSVLGGRSSAVRNFSRSSVRSQNLPLMKTQNLRSFCPFPNCPAIAFFVENSTERDRKRA